MFDKPKRATTDEVLGWEAAADARMSPRTREQIINRIRMANPVRWRRLQRDLRWLRRQMKKMGLNPDEARELL